MQRIGQSCETCSAVRELWNTLELMTALCPVIPSYSCFFSANVGKIGSSCSYLKSRNRSAFLHQIHKFLVTGLSGLSSVRLLRSTLTYWQISDALRKANIGRALCLNLIIMFWPRFRPGKLSWEVIQRITDHPWELCSFDLLWLQPPWDLRRRELFRILGDFA